MIQSILRFIKEKRGNVLIPFSLGMPVLMGAGGLSVDVSLWVDQRAALQAAADSAALAAAGVLLKADGTTDTEAKAKAVASAFAAANTAGREVDVTVDVATRSATVTVREPAKKVFASLFGVSDFALAADSHAVISERRDGRTCVLALDPAAKTGVLITGSATFDARGCTVWSNSTSDTSVTIGGSAQVTVTKLCAAGKVSVNGTSASITGALMAGCKQQADPLANWLAPTGTHCSKNAKGTQINQGDVTLSPGTYCGGLSVTASGKVTLLPGIYVIDGGPLKITADGDVSGDGVGLYMTGKQATADISGQGTVRLKAASSGAMDGIVLASNRADVGNYASRIAGGAVVELAGTTYLPNQDFVWRGNSRSLDPTRITQVIAKTVDIAGTTSILYEADFESEDYAPVLTVQPDVYLGH
ncbi:pilus assembly protein TadG-related protein [Chthonobacter rhizosphaerae]|uniref:pilus assembly protein TadG-related protein n=1 Tax=Chthonobacter rhizosphaerae TaxID=2735553 RepID=UPI0015EE6934|nr:pilus assembly protein TadG-related protein [Chthonobacter rhizosphaerae]